MLLQTDVPVLQLIARGERVGAACAESPAPALWGLHVQRALLLHCACRTLALGLLKLLVQIDISFPQTRSSKVQ